MTVIDTHAIKVKPQTGYPLLVTAPGDIDIGDSVEDLHGIGNDDIVEPLIHRHLIAKISSRAEFKLK